VIDIKETSGRRRKQTVVSRVSLSDQGKQCFPKAIEITVGAIANVTQVEPKSFVNRYLTLRTVGQSRHYIAEIPSLNWRRSAAHL
jgi:hypothetical protein